MLLSNCAVYNNKLSIFIKEQGASGLLDTLGIITLFSKIPLAGPVLFQRHWQFIKRFKMNDLVNSFLLGENKFHVWNGFNTWYCAG